MTTKLETPDQQYRRILTCLTAWREQTSLAAQAYYEAKTSECWRKHHDTWKDFIEACGFTEEWGRQLSLTGERISELRALLLENSEIIGKSESGCNSVVPKNSESLGKLNTLTPGIRKVLDSVPLASQVEALGKTPAGKPLTVKAVRQAVKDVVEPTAAKIKEAAEQIVSPPKTEPKKSEPVVECDRFGHEIPADIFPDWQRAEQVQELLTQLSQIKRIVKNGLEEIDGKRKDVIFAELSNSLEATLGNAYGDLKRVLPWTICPTCSARKATRPKCVLCKQRGWLSKFLYETAVVGEVRSMWEKSKKK